MAQEIAGGPYKMTRQLAKWNNYRTPDTGPPDEVLDAAWWYEPDGTEITDPARIAALEAKLQEEQN